MKNYKYFTTFIALLLVICNGIQPSSADEASVIIDLQADQVKVTSEGNEFLSGDDELAGEVIFADQDSQILVGESSENSVQLLISIDSSSAPSDYSFEIPGLVTIENLKVGKRTLHRLVGPSDSTLGWLAEAWAHDANDQKISTSFAVQGNVLIQHIDTNQDGIRYPITADPYLGKNLISSVTKEVISGNNLLHVKVSNWMWDVYGIYTGTLGVAGYTTAYQIAVNYGWQEVLDKVGAKYGAQYRGYVATKATLKDQFDCHAFGAPALYVGAILGTDPQPTWDLESYRSHVQDAGVWISSHCNW